MESQLIIELLKQENEELYSDKMQMEMLGLSNRVKLAQLENQIIDTLVENKTGILDDDSMVKILAVSSNTVNDIALADLVLYSKVASVQAILGNYERLCKEAAAIYSHLGSLNRINPMLNWSYASFIKNFLAACLESVSEEVTTF